MNLAIFGFGFSTIWVCLSAWYFSSFIGLDNFLSLLPNEIGEFFAGLFAPLFFIWLIVGYFQQNKELRLNNRVLRQQAEELRRSVEQADRQAQAISANELHARRDTFLRVAELTIDELNSMAIDLCRRLANSTVMESTFDKLKSGEKDAFFKPLIHYFVRGSHVTTIQTLKGFMNWPEILGRFCSKFQRLLDEAQECDPNGHLLEHFNNSAIGKLSWLLRDVVDETADRKGSDAAISDDA